MREGSECLRGLDSGRHKPLRVIWDASNKAIAEMARWLLRLGGEGRGCVWLMCLGVDLWEPDPGALLWPVGVASCPASTSASDGGKGQGFGCAVFLDYW